MYMGAWGETKADAFFNRNYFFFHLICNRLSRVLLLLIINLHYINIYYCSGPQKNPKALGSKMSSVKLFVFQLQWEGVIILLHVGRGELCV